MREGEAAIKHVRKRSIKAPLQLAESKTMACNLLAQVL